MLNKTSSYEHIPDIFPQVYREESPEFVAFVQAYYEHLETIQQLDYFKITDIDETYEEFLKYFQKTHLKDLDLEFIGNQRLITKHIQDLYSRKGSEEGLRLLFKLFFRENIELFYPSVSLLTPSSSEYFNNAYIEMENVLAPQEYDLQRGMRILGQTTGATAYIEEVVFKNFDGNLAPLVFLSNKRGEFTVDDVIIILDSQGEFFRYSTQKIAGSMSELVFDSVNQSSPNNNVGDEYNVVTADVLKKPGRYGRVMAREVTAASAGSITLNVSERGYGYTIPEVAVEGIITEPVFAQNFDATQVIFQPDSAFVPTNEHALVFENTSKFYRVESVVPFPNKAGNFAVGPYTIEIQNGFYADEGETLNILIETDPNIVDGTTVDVTLTTPGIDPDPTASDIAGGLTTYTVTITGQQGILDVTLSNDNVSDGIKEMFVSVAGTDSTGTFTGQPSVAITVNDTSNPVGPVSATEQIRYIVTLETPVEKDYVSGFPCKFVDRKTVSDLYISNQVLVIDNDSAVKFTLLQIADELDRIAVGLTQSSNPGDPDTDELFAYLTQMDPQGKYMIGDINNSGAIAESDSTYLRNAYNGDGASISLIGDRFDRYTKPNFERLELITYIDNGDISRGHVVKYVEPLLYVSTSEYVAFPEGTEEFSAERPSGTTFTVTRVAEYNDTARFELQTVGNYQEQINIFTLTCEELFETVIEDIETTLLSDLSPTKQFTIGEIGVFKTIDSGFDYTTETFFVLDQPYFAAFDKHDFYVEIQDLPVILFAGDEITQNITSFNGDPYIAKGTFLRREGNKYFFRSKSFFQFDADIPFTIYNLEFQADSIIYDLTSPRMGENAEIVSTTTYGKGQIKSVKILNTGYRYEDGSLVNLVNDEGVSIATATVRSLGTGFSQGQWRTTKSHLNAEARVLQDSNYYQEFSFDVGSVLTPDKYEKIVRDVVQTAGTKMFSTPLINTNNNAVADVLTEIAFFEVKKEPMITENDALSPVEASRNRYPEQELRTEDSPFRADTPIDFATVETEALTTLTI